MTHDTHIPNAGACGNRVQGGSPREASMKHVIVVTAVACALLSLAVPAAQSQVPRAKGAIDYSPSVMCGGCHDEIVGQQLESEHEASFTNPLFQAQYFQEVLPRVAKDPALTEEATLCIACHAPVAHKRT